MNKQVDIIIPIYNALDDLKICLNSLYKNTDLKRNRLVLINDCSSDLDVLPFLQQQTCADKNIIVINNESNKGFSANINIGMAQSAENDVILLNSDTVLISHWVEKLQECAYSRKEIGTVTPVSNNATLCSVPLFCEENKLPDDIDIDTAAAIVERCSFKQYPRITVANGFCMYVKREVIDLIGNFDAETFGRGYGEENDFCNRAEQAGYIHVMCDDTYIYHSGTKSFVSKEKEEYIRQHDMILNKRYPEQMHNNAIHCRDNPNRKISDNIGLYFDLYNDKKNILYLVQSDFREGASDNIGGTQLHVRDLVYSLKDKYNIYVVARDGLAITVTAYVNDKVKLFTYNILSENDYFVFSDAKQCEFWRNILVAFNIDLIHVHHTYGMSFDVFGVARELEIPVILTLHDFYFICPTVKMLDEKGKLCIGDIDTDRCKSCLKKQFGCTEHIDGIKIWRKKCTGYLEGVQKIIVPSQSAKSIIAMYYPLVEEKINIIEHGYHNIKEINFNSVVVSSDVMFNIERCQREDNGYRISGWAYEIDGNSNNNDIWLKISKNVDEKLFIPATTVNRQDVIYDPKNANCGFYVYLPDNIVADTIEVEIYIKTKDRILKSDKMQIKLSDRKKRREPKLRVAFIGGLNAAKGGEKVAEIIEKGSKDIDWFVFGEIGVEKLDNLKSSNLIKTGYYKTQNLPALLKIYNIDVICILSLWPETYSYTLTEAVLNGIPVIVTNIGALGERTNKYNYGWTVDVNNVNKEVQDILDKIFKNPDLLEEKKKNIAASKIKNLKEMSDEYIRLYSGYFKDKSYDDGFDSEYVYNGVCNSSKINKYIQSDYDEYKAYEAAYRELNHLKGTIGYKVMLFIQKVRFPFKTQLEKLIKKR